MPYQPWKANLILIHLKGEDFDHEAVSKEQLLTSCSLMNSLNLQLNVKLK